MLSGKLCHCRMSSLQPMHRVGGLVGCSTASIGSWTLLGLQEIAPQRLLAWNDVCAMLEASKWARLCTSHIYLTGKVTSQV